MTIARYACHGLGIVQPIDVLALDLNRATPDLPPFQIVGGTCPPLEQGEIEGRLLDAHADIIWIGHSMGAALGFYLTQKLKGLKFRLVITVDPMDWASNINCEDWQRNPPHPGEWVATGNFNRWINIHSDMYPGGGRLVGTNPKCEDHHFPGADHIGIIALPEVRKIIMDAVSKAA